MLFRSYDFPCATHGDSYDDIVIAIDELHLAELHASGYLTSAEWYAKNLGIIADNPAITETPKKRGRPAKS